MEHLYKALFLLDAMMKEIFTRLDLKGECLNSIFPKPISAEVEIHCDLIADHYYKRESAISATTFQVMQQVISNSTESSSIEKFTAYVVDSVYNAKAVETPFYHLEFDHVFPENLFEEMLKAMPVYSDYRAMSGRSKDKTNAKPTRVKIDLFPEYIRHLPMEKRVVWNAVGEILCSEPVKQAFRDRLAKPLAKRFGPNSQSVGMYPIPILTRDIPGYSIAPHTDTHWKGITVQLYLPPDDSVTHIGTIFLEKKADGQLQKVSQMKFARNSGYAFAVGDDTWHSADPVGNEVKTRDSILLTYFVDSGAVKILRNRGKRLGNMIRNEARHLLGGS